MHHYHPPLVRRTSDESLSFTLGQHPDSSIENTTSDVGLQEIAAGDGNKSEPTATQNAPEGRFARQQRLAVATSGARATLKSRAENLLCKDPSPAPDGPEERNPTALGQTAASTSGARKATRFLRRHTLGGCFYLPPAVDGLKTSKDSNSDEDTVP